LRPRAPAIDVTEIQPGVWTALQSEENSLNDSNSLIVAADEYLIVVDAQESADDVRQIIAFARDEVRKPIRYVINTHWHGDHTQGNTLYEEAYGDALVIMGHATLAEDIPARAAPQLAERIASIEASLPAAREQLRTGIKRDGSKMTPEELAAQTARVERAEAWARANKRARFTVPTMPVNDRYEQEAGAASFVLYPMRGHTRGDLVVHFPRLGIVATGDLVDVVPYAGHGYPHEWIAALESIGALEARLYVPGHGQVLNDRSRIEKLISYFRSLTTQVDSLVATGLPLEKVEEKVDLSQSRALLAGDDEHAQRFFDEVRNEAIERAYAEAPQQAN
jgi:glyoxylase-like metal-dependent hydrolase (beta-lactamase superfamily II)